MAHPPDSALAGPVCICLWSVCVCERSTARLARLDDSDHQLLSASWKEQAMFDVCDHPCCGAQPPLALWLPLGSWLHFSASLASRLFALMASWTVEVRGFGTVAMDHVVFPSLLPSLLHLSQTGTFSNHDEHEHKAGRVVVVDF